MSLPPSSADRRNLLKAAAVLAAVPLALRTAAAAAGQDAAAADAGDKPAAAGTVPRGKPGEFDFLSGEWRIRHRRLRRAGSDDWDEFEGEATVWSILGGRGSVEELRIPARDFAGMGLRLFDQEQGLWTDFWVNAKSGVLTPPGQTGRFVDGAGVFEADDRDGDQPIKVRGVWDRITPTSCRWHQALSRDGGKSWEGNWYMDWRRVA